MTPWAITIVVATKLGPFRSISEMEGGKRNRENEEGFVLEQHRQAARLAFRIIFFTTAGGTIIDRICGDHEYERDRYCAKHSREKKDRETAKLPTQIAG
jgi:hypothetical protein